LEGRRAAVTGAAMGIGRAIAGRFVEAGAQVLLTDLDDAALQVVVKELDDGTGRVAGLALDVGDDDAGDRLVDAAVAAFGGLDVLVNNAGIYPQTPLLEMPVDLLDRVLRVNLRGAVLLARATARHLVDRGGAGSILNIASIDSLHPSMVGLAACDTSKGGLWMFTKSLALELAPHRIRVNAIAPGGIATEGTRKPFAGSGLSEDEMAHVMGDFAAAVPMGRMGEPDEIALAAVFVCSDAASYMTGSLLVVDGGALLG
jgi:2-deoxy-D-gluconate 3-dehydrogenase